MESLTAMTACSEANNIMKTLPDLPPGSAALHPPVVELSSAPSRQFPWRQYRLPPQRQLVIFSDVGYTPSLQPASGLWLAHTLLITASSDA